MKVISDYLKEYGKYTFLEKDFNEVDNVILSMLSYNDFNGIVPTIDNGSITLKEAADLFFKTNDKKTLNKQIIAKKAASKMLKEMSNTNRFKDLLLLNYEYQVTFDTQFGAMCIKLPNKMMYVSYEGTDQNMSGWEEDFVMGVKFPIPAQKLAIEYLNMVVSINPFGSKVYVGGHSKGGNLALVASMYCHNHVYRKIKQVYNNDGPGLRSKQFTSIRYRRISHKYTHIIPEETVFGLILNHEGNYIVVKSTKKNLLQHNGCNWVVEKDHFKTGKLSKFSLRVKNAFTEWLQSSTVEDREEFVKVLFSIFRKANITDIVEVKKAMLPNMLSIAKEMKNISQENKEILLNVLMAMYSGWRG